MYKCLDCDCIFENPKKFIERHGLDTPPYEEFFGCPVCGGSFEEYDEYEESEDEDEENED